MQHARHYTLEEANALRPWVAERVRRLRDARQVLAAARPAVLVPQAAADGGSWPGAEHAAAAVSVLLTLEELDARDVVVRDPERGIVDFPALRGGEEVYLCWLVGEQEVAHWHGLQAGFLGRRRL